MYRSTVNFTLCYNLQKLCHMLLAIKILFKYYRNKYRYYNILLTQIFNEFSVHVF